MSAKTEAQVQRMKTQTIGVEIEMAEITRNTQHGKPRRRQLRRMELQRHTGQTLDGNKGRQHKGNNRQPQGRACNPDPYLRRS